jgi:hypothetical protein
MPVNKKPQMAKGVLPKDIFLKAFKDLPDIEK